MKNTVEKFISYMKDAVSIDSSSDNNAVKYNMKMSKITEKYSDAKTWYINIREVVNYIKELYNNKFTVSVIEFLKINELWTQPFMEYSLRKEQGYTKEEILVEINNLKEKLFKTNIKEHEMFFEILVKK